ncbi:hypothetical protein GC176_13670 [bacterium]|nr:hypothetical protein [bacterium]
MLRPIRCALSIAAGAAFVASASSASAQWFPSFNCGCAPPQPIVQQQCMTRVPVTQQVMQQVAVTEYQQVKQKVKRPVTEVEYIEQPVTTYRPVVETLTRDVPVTTYQDVTECQTVTKNCGYWQTNWYRNPKVTPCEYDPTPGPLGWLNRTAYSVRSALTPNMIATRQYVPQTVAQQVPVTRRVALQSVQKQQYQVTRYVPEQTTRKVAVNRIKWVEDEVIAMKPVTVVKNVPVTRTAWTWAPVGTAMALAPSSTQLSLAPTADPISTAKKPDENRTARRPVPEPRDAGDGDVFDDRGEIDRIEGEQSRRTSVKPTDDGLGQIQKNSTEMAVAPAPSTKSLFVPVGPRSSRSVSVARVSGWKATNHSAESESPILLPAAATIAAR